jgi:hypothetical protein
MRARMMHHILNEQGVQNKEQAARVLAGSWKPASHNSRGRIKRDADLTAERCCKGA